MHETLADIGLDDEARAFRREVAAFLRSTADRRDRFQIFKDRGGATEELYQALGERGWLSVTWPKERGGLGLPALYEFLVWDEMAYARAARPPLGAGMVARSILEFGNAWQHEKFLPGVMAAKEGFALGYSEPEAGSDLTGLRTRARRDGDTYIVTGEKRWTSDAHTARWLWLLCRTGPVGSRSDGLSMLIVDLASPGISISPIPTLDGHHLNEVRLDDVVVPASHLVGKEGDAWQMIRTALARERHLQVMPGRVERDLEALAVLLARLPDSGRGERDKLGDLVSRGLALRTAVLRSVMLAGREEIQPTVAARNKIVGTVLMQEIARTAMRIGDRQTACRGDDLEMLWRESISETIGGGTTEMMLDVVARHHLAAKARTR